mgnify:CR=1 FL=1
MKIDPRYTQASGRDIFSGNELLVKGALETEGGVHLLTGYPGSPIAGFFDTCQEIAALLEEHGIVARISNNEALGVAMANGAQMVGCRTMVAMKSVGLHVASDALALGVLAGTKGEGGTVVVCGDDPWSDSTQAPVDSRFMAEHLRMPMLEPATPQEVKDWVDLAFRLCRAGQVYIGYMMTVTLADGGGSVDLRPNQYPEFNAQQKRTISYEKDIKPDLDQFVLLPPRSWQRELGMGARHAAVVAEARRLGVNRIINRPQRGEELPLGFVASGAGYAYLAQALSEMGLAGRLPILKLGLSYPVDGELVREFAEHCEHVVIVEERRSFVERQVREALSGPMQRGELRSSIWGKTFPNDLPGIPSTRGLHPSLLIERLVPLLRSYGELPRDMTNGKLSSELARIERTTEPTVNIPARTPAFCPGCPHRDSSSVLLELRKDLLDAEYMRREHKRGPVDLVAHGDTGCYTMLMFEPNTPLMHNYSGMGLGGATGAGVDPFIDNKQLVFMGDGTFFHSGQTAISNSIAQGQDITYIILDNRTTAMTGHQPHAGNDVNLVGATQFAQDIERIAKGMVPKEVSRDVRIARIDPADRDRYRRTMEQTILADGVKILIADKECGITFHRRRKREDRKVAKELGYLPKQAIMNVAEEVCEFCLECTSQTGCPGLKIVDTDYGSKMQTDASWCVNDGACARIEACPAFEQVTITRQAPPRSGDEYVDLSNIPDPPRPVHADQDTWRCYLAGVGGMGIGLATSILVKAGQEMGYRVQFLDKKGLAIRNGGVYSQLVFTRESAALNTSPTIPYGKADLLLGIDLLEITRSIDPKLPYRVAGPDKTAAVVNTAKTPTILTLLGRDDFRVEDLESTLQQSVREDQYFGFNVGDLCERVLDNKLYANIMMLGIAFQLGYLPVDYPSLEKAIRQVIRSDIERNLRAFQIGRMIAVKPRLFVVENRREFETARQAFRRKTNTLRLMYKGRKGQRLAKRFRVLMRQTFRATRFRPVGDALMRDVVIRAYDCVIWGGIDYAKRYCTRVVQTFERDTADHDYALTRAVVWNLAKVMLIKDEPYVAAMLTSPEKYKRDQRRYKVNPARGDKIAYEHYNRPEFDVFGKKIAFRWKSKDWQLRLMARARWLRELMPKWHQREREYRDWFETIVDRLQWQNDAEYRKWERVLRTPEPVTGFREVRYPKMEAARAKAEALLSESYDEPTPPGEPRITVSLSDRILEHA